MSVTFSQRLARRLRGGGLRWLTNAIFDRVAPARPRMSQDVIDAVTARRGLEIGGPSRVFTRRGILPVYSFAVRIDNVNFSTRTTWEDRILEGGEFRFDARHTPGTQWVREAVTLSGFDDNSYDFVLSSHCLEHVANPFRALHEWRRITRDGGHLILVLPNRDKTFDHNRPVTTMAHLRDDFSKGTSEEDLTHADEAIALHDIARDPGVGSPDEFRERVRDNAHNRCLHHHVFDLELIRQMLCETGWHVRASEAVRPMHLAAFAQKPRK